LGVLYPFGGTILVPSDAAQSVTIVVGVPEEEALRRVFDERTLRLETVIENATGVTAALTAQRQELRAYLEQLQLSDSIRELRNQTRELGETRAELTTQLNAVLFRAGNLLNALQAFERVREPARDQLEHLRGVGGTYNITMEALRKTLDEHKQTLHNWAGPLGEEWGAQLDELEAATSEFQATVAGRTHEFDVVQMYLGCVCDERDRPSDDEGTAAWQAIVEMVPSLEVSYARMTDTFEAFTASLMEGETGHEAFEEASSSETW